MPYDIKRNYGGCKGYAVVGPGGPHGCHPSRKKAIEQQRALYAAEAQAKKSHDGTVTNENTPNKYPEHNLDNCPDPKNCPDHMNDNMDKKKKKDENELKHKNKNEMNKEEDVDKQSPCWDGYVQRGMKPGKDGSMVPNCVPVKKSEELQECCPDQVMKKQLTNRQTDTFLPSLGI
jgi:hypothetical protein